MSRQHAAWWSVVGVLALIDVICDRRHNHSTMSCAVRHTFHTDTRAGRLVVIAGWAGLTAWVLPHWFRHELDAALEAIDLANLTNDGTPA